MQGSTVSSNVIKNLENNTSRKIALIASRILQLTGVFETWAKPSYALFAFDITPRGRNFINAGYDGYAMAS